MKQIITFALTAVLAITFASCGKNYVNQSSNTLSSTEDSSASPHPVGWGIDSVRPDWKSSWEFNEMNNNACYLAKDSSILVQISLDTLCEEPDSCCIIRIVRRRSKLSCPSIVAKGTFMSRDTNNVICTAQDGNIIVEVWEDLRFRSIDEEQSNRLFRCRISKVEGTELDKSIYADFWVGAAVPISPVYLKDIKKWWRKK